MAGWLRRGERLSPLEAMLCAITLLPERYTSVLASAHRTCGLESPNPHLQTRADGLRSGPGRLPLSQCSE